MIVSSYYQEMVIIITDFLYQICSLSSHIRHTLVALIHGYLYIKDHPIIFEAFIIFISYTFIIVLCMIDFNVYKSGCFICFHLFWDLGLLWQRIFPMRNILLHRVI